MSKKVTPLRALCVFGGLSALFLLVGLLAAVNVMGFGNFLKIVTFRDHEVLVKPAGRTEGSPSANQVPAPQESDGAGMPPTTSEPPGTAMVELSAVERLALVGPFLTLATASLTLLGLCVTIFTAYLAAMRARDAALQGTWAAQIAMIRGKLDTIARPGQIELSKQVFYPEDEQRMVAYFKAILDQTQEGRRISPRVMADISMLFDIEKRLAEQHKDISDRGGKMSG